MANVAILMGSESDRSVMKATEDVLDQMGVAIRSGHHCAQPLLDKFQISSSNRVSLSIYNSFDEVDKFIYAMNKAIKILL